MFIDDKIGKRGISPIQFLIIIQLKIGPKYGYEILRMLRDHFKDVWDPKTGTIYPAIRSLERKGFVEREPRGDKGFYRLTEKGNDFIDQIGERMEEDMGFSNRYFEFVLKWMPDQLKLKIAPIIKNKTSEFEPSSLFVKYLIDDKMDKASQLEVLEGIRSVFERRLERLEREIEKIKEAG